MATINNAAKAAQSNNGSNLKFITTMTVEEFKSTFGTDKLRCFNENENHQNIRSHRTTARLAGGKN